MAPEAHATRKAGDAASATNRDDTAFFPLTMPLTTGPGSISVAIALASERPGDEPGLLAFFGGLTLAAVANVLFVYVAYAWADQILRLLGEPGARALNRLAAFLLLCIGVQIVSTGAESLIRPWFIGLRDGLHR